MGAALAQCGFRAEHLGAAFSSIADNEDLIVEVVSTADDSQGARPSGLKQAQQLQVSKLATLPGLEPLGFRFRETIRSKWPDDYRFQAPKRAWRAMIATGAGTEAFVLQMAGRSEERTLEAAGWDLEDSRTASSYAHRFNLYSRERAREAGYDGEQVPSVKVAAPVACRIVKTNLPALLPVGAACTLYKYSDKEVKKFVFDGSQDFLEVAQTFFHHAAFSSGGKEMVCDIQGVEEEDGSLLLIDPCILRAGKVTLGSVLKGAASKEEAIGAQAAACLGPAVAPAAEKFDQLHPKCAPLCKAFDPARTSVKQKTGVCGMDISCGLK
ncbi:unnamed protein product [Effrenium voratum]|nr:unnamed protein product [Effrenium voratum]